MIKRNVSLRDQEWIFLKEIQTSLIKKYGRNVTLNEVIKILIESWVNQ